jgi:flavin-binding protein dodecin
MPKVVKVIEVLAESDKGWEEAAQEAVSHAAKTLRNIRSVYISDFQGIVENNKIVQFRLDAKISFVLDE